jgi:plastocyanin
MLMVIVMAAIGLTAVDASAAGTVQGTLKSALPQSIVDTVVYKEKVDASFPAPATYETMDQKRLVFIPHVLPILKETVVEFLKSDQVRHNVFSPSQEKYDTETWPMEKPQDRTFDKVGVHIQQCNVHEEMEGTIVMLLNPFFGLIKKHGAFEIANVQPVTYVLKAWQEKLTKKQLQKITVVDNQTTTVTFTL